MALQGKLTDADFMARRKRLVESLMNEGYLSKREVISAMLKIPRHFFLPENLADQAYGDYPLGIGEDQTISAPHMVAIMCERLDLRKGNRVLEIGSGSGYHAAVVAEIIGDSGHVYTIERITLLAESAKQNISKCGLAARIDVSTGDGSLGLPERAPFDRIYVTAASPQVPVPLIDQLKDGGKMLIPVGERFYQELIAVGKNGTNIVTENYGGCIFVPLIGEHGHNP